MASTPQTFTFSPVTGATAAGTADTVFEIPNANSSSTITFTSNGMEEGQFFLVRNNQDNLSSSKTIAMYSGVFEITEGNTSPTVTVQASTTAQIMLRTGGDGTRVFFFNPI